MLSAHTILQRAPVPPRPMALANFGTKFGSSRTKFWPITAACPSYRKPNRTFSSRFDRHRPEEGESTITVFGTSAAMSPLLFELVMMSVRGCALGWQQGRSQILERTCPKTCHIIMTPQMTMVAVTLMSDSQLLSGPQP